MKATENISIQHLGRKTYRLTAEILLPAPLEDVFHFFADATNLEALTPSTLQFQVLTKTPIEMTQGAVIDYRLKIHRIPVHWQSEITSWAPPNGFVDEQKKGPYRLWIHKHSFQQHEPGTLVKDDVTYRVPGGRIVHRLFVRGDLKQIFAFRHRVLTSTFAPA